MGSILLGAFVGFIVTLLLGVTLGLLLPFVGVLIGMFLGGFVAGVIAGGVVRGAIAGLLAGLLGAVIIVILALVGATLLGGLIGIRRIFRWHGRVSHRHHWRHTCCLGSNHFRNRWSHRRSNNKIDIFAASFLFIENLTVLYATDLGCTW